MLKDLMNTEGVSTYKNTIVDPAFGHLFEITGTLKYLRLFSPLIDMTFEGGERVYEKDESKDPFVENLILLFNIKSHEPVYSNFIPPLSFSERTDEKAFSEQVDLFSNALSDIFVSIIPDLKINAELDQLLNEALDAELGEEPSEAPSEGMSEAFGEGMSKEPGEALIEAVNEAMSEGMSEESSEAMSEALIEAMNEESVKKPGEEPVKKPGEEPGEALIEAMNEESVKKPGEEPVKKPGEALIEAMNEAMSKEPGEAMSKEPSEAMSKESSEAMNEESVKKPGEGMSEESVKKPGEEPGEALIEAVNEAMSEGMSEESSEAMNEALIEAINEALIEAMSEESSEAMSEESVKKPGEALDAELGEKPGEALDAELGEKPGEALDAELGEKPGEALGEAVNEGMSEKFLILKSNFLKESSIEMFKDQYIKLIFVQQIALKVFKRKEDMLQYVKKVISRLESQGGIRLKGGALSALGYFISFNSPFKLKSNVHVDVIDILLEYYNQNISFPCSNTNIAASNYQKNPIYFKSKIEETPFQTADPDCSRNGTMAILLFHLFGSLYHKRILENSSGCNNYFSKFFVKYLSSAYSAEAIISKWVKEIKTPEKETVLDHGILKMIMKINHILSLEDSLRIKQILLLKYSSKVKKNLSLEDRLRIKQILLLKESLKINKKEFLSKNQEDLQKNLFVFFEAMGKKFDVEISDLSLSEMQSFMRIPGYWDIKGDIKFKISYGYVDEYTTVMLRLCQDRNEFHVINKVTNCFNALNFFLNNINSKKLPLPYLLLKRYVSMSSEITQTVPVDFIDFYINGNNPSKEFLVDTKVKLLNRLNSFILSTENSSKNHARCVFMGLILSFDLEKQVQELANFKDSLANDGFIDQNDFSQLIRAVLKNIFSNADFKPSYLESVIKLRGNVLNEISIEFNDTNYTGNNGKKISATLELDMLLEKHKFTLDFYDMVGFTNFCNSIVCGQSAIRKFELHMNGTAMLQNNAFIDN
ncbi:hypothetical protein GINT2_002133 [Glugoides intestinalis]